MSSLSDQLRASIEMVEKGNQEFSILVARFDAVCNRIKRLVADLDTDWQHVQVHESLDAACLGLQECLRRSYDNLWKAMWELGTLTADLKEPKS